MLYIRGRQIIAAILVAVAIFVMWLAQNSANKQTSVYLIDSTGIDSKYAEESIQLGYDCSRVKVKEDADIVAEVTTSLTDNTLTGGTKFCVGYCSFLLNFDNGSIIDKIEEKIKLSHSRDYKYSIAMKEFMLELAKDDTSWLDSKKGEKLKIYIPNKGSLEYEFVIQGIRELLADGLGETDSYSQIVTDKLNNVLSKLDYFGNYDVLSKLLGDTWSLAILPNYVVQSEYELRNNYIISDSTNYNLMLYVTLWSNKLDINDEEIYSRVLSGFDNSGIMNYTQFTTVEPYYWVNYSNLNSMNKLEKAVKQDK